MSVVDSVFSCAIFVDLDNIVELVKHVISYFYKFCHVPNTSTRAYINSNKL
jgi:hypothetical protein